MPVVARRMRPVKRGAIALLILGFAFLGGESGARYYGCPHPYSALFAYDEKLGYRSPVNTKVSFSAGAHTYNVAFDENGIADRAGEGSVEVVILGDGVTAGLELPPQDRMAHQMSRLLGNKSVINLSVTGYGTIQQALLLEEWLKSNKGRPKHVILVFNLTNDIIDNVREWDGDANPTVSLQSLDGRILPPVLPGLVYRIVAESYRQSRLAGCLNRPSKADASTARLPAEIVGLFEDRLSPEMGKALLGTKRGFDFLADLARQHSFQLQGLFWNDMGELASLPSEKIVTAENHIKAMATGINWIKSDASSTSGASSDWDTRNLVRDARHANAPALRDIAKTLALALTDHDR